MVDADTAMKSAKRAQESAMAAGHGYADAIFAAYGEIWLAGLEFWSSAVTGTVPDRKERSAPFGHSAEDWSGLPWLDPVRTESWTRHMFPVTPLDVFNAWAGVMPLRGTSTAWPTAKLMIDSGVPRSVAWPAAQANAAAIDAAAAVVEPMRKVFAAAHGETGFVVSPLTNINPHVVGMFAAWLAMPGVGLLILSMTKPPFA